MDSSSTFLFDIGASHTKIGFSRDDDTIESTQIYPTPQGFEEGVATLTQKALDISQGKMSLAVGGIAGPLNREKTMITAAPNLPDWNNKPLLEELSKVLNAKVVLENDTAMVGLGEAVKGPGSPFNIVAYMTISTGVNGVLVVDKKIAPNAFGYEIGSQLVDFDHTYDKDSYDFEELVAGSQFKRRFGAQAHEITDPNIWNEEARLVAIGLHNLILFWSPEVVILGGSVAKSIPLDAVIKNVSESLRDIYSDLPQIKKAELGDVGGLWGALHYAKLLS